MADDATPEVSVRRPGSLDPSTVRRARTEPPGLAVLVVIELVLAVGVVVWALSGSVYGAGALACAAVVAAMVIPWRSGGSAASRIARRVAFRVARMRRGTLEDMPAPFDIPLTGPDRRAGVSAPATIGARWVGESLITVLSVRPGNPALTFLTPDAVGFDDPRGQVIPLDALAQCLDPFDIPLSSIDVVSHGSRSHGEGRAAATYLRTLGPLPGTAHRSVLVILRLDPRDCPDAVARRGGGAVGALRAATITTRRVARRLAEHGLAANALSASEITAATGYLAGGHRPGDMTENWSDLHAGHARMQVAAVEPAALPAVLARVWTEPAASTTVTLRLCRGAEDRLRVIGLVRFDQRAPADGTDPAPLPSGLRALPGRQFDAFTAGLPAASPTRLSRHLPAIEGEAAATLLASLTWPAAGCGQLIGADARGRAVAMTLCGPDIDEVRLSGTTAFVAQTVLRTVAIGIPVVIHTTARHHWQAVVASVADRRFLVFAEDAAPTMRAGVEVFDGLRPTTRGSATRFVICTDDHERTPPIDGVTELRQNMVAPQQITAKLPTCSADVTIVATPEEWALVGRSSAAAAFA